MKKEMKKKEVFEFLSGQADFLSAASDAVWDNPETCFQEAKSSEILCRALEEAGFAVERDVAGIKTAFTGTFGHGHPVIGFLGEFDALSGLSQESGCAEKSPLVPGGNGHGCGHNLLGVGALAGAMGMKKYLEETGKEGTVIYFGTPAEEGGSGKTFMAREGCFDGLDCALSWHPGNFNGASSGSTLANCQVYYRYKGVSSHAALTPHLGRSALDAVELLNVGVQFLREHIVPEARIHYAITDTGGFAPNVVQPKAEVLYLMRAPTNVVLDDIYQRVTRIAQGAAMMTDTEVEVDFVKACSNTVPNDVLGQLLTDNLMEAEKPTYSDSEVEFIRKIAATTPDGEKAGLRRRITEIPDHRITPEERARLLARLDEPIHDFVMPFVPSNAVSPVSVDAGDVSWITPTAMCGTATWAAGTPAHSWQAVAVGKSELAHKNMLLAGQVLAGAAIDLIEKPELLAEAKAELERRLNGVTYQCPIPKGVQPRVISK